MSPRRLPVHKTRNIGIMAHIDAGKTTVTERILFYTGRMHRIGEVHDGEATMDWMDQERERGITISSAVTAVQWNEHELHIIDTPGHVDFTVEVERSLRVLDGVIALYDAVAGVEPQSETVWYQAERYHVPRLGFVNKMDRVGADHARCIEQVREILHAHPIPIQIPIGEGNDFTGVIDLIRMRALSFSTDDQGATMTPGPIPDAMQAEAEVAREHMIELLADVDDDIAGLYLEGEEISVEQIIAGLRAATIALEAVPFLCGSGLRNKGIQPLLDAVVDFLPAPDDLPDVHGITPDGQGQTRMRDDHAPLAALVFKVQIIDGRKIVYARVYSGVLEENAQVLNATNDQKIRIKNIFLMHANRRERVKEARSGEIVALDGTRNAVTGDTLCAVDAPIILEKITARAPVISAAIEPETLRERDKLSEALAKLVEEDPTLLIEENEETGEMIMRGMGELHLEIVCDRLEREFGVSVRRGKPNVVRRETIQAPAIKEGRFLREADDERIFGQVTVRVTPRPRGSGNAWELALPEDHPYIKPAYGEAAVQGVQDALSVGPVSGEDLDDVFAEIVAIHDDAKGGNLVLGTRIAAGEAVRKAVIAAEPVVLEPLMSVDVVIGEEQLGEIIGDLTLRSGTIENVAESAGRRVVHALVPLRSMFGYTSKLRSMTQGRGVFSMEFRCFDRVGS